MKKLIYVAFASLAILAAGSPARADRGTAFYDQTKINAGGARKMYKPQICRTSLSSTCVVCSSAGKSGILVGVNVSSGAVGSWAVAIDTGAIPTVGLTGPHATTGAGALIARQKTCEYTLATVDTNKGDCGRASFEDGLPFDNGLTVCASADVVSSLVFYETRLP